jgi:TolB-like protein/tetratricopeptide (TPR) repeat protein
MRHAVLPALLLSAAVTASAQCPDGSPPPCRARATTTATIAPRHIADPPLSDATWIVLPFDNVSKAPDVDWLRDGSVNLLYLDLSKWTDIRVVDDERVADLLREVPEAQGGKQLSLATGLAVARRAGAGKLVMGDVLKIGGTTAVTAKVFDVRAGQRIRTVRQESTVQDSLMPSFGKLAQGILNLEAPKGTNIGTIGTNSTSAYQDYLEGVKALNHFDLKTARRHLDDALAKDSTFALPHYKLAVLIGWENPGDEAKLTHARTAVRFSTGLPQRERTLAASLMAFDNAEYGRACTGYRSLVHADSTDVEALYGLGECLFHDNVVEAVAGDTTRLRYRGSYNQAIAAFKRTLELDPTYHLAFQHILDAYGNDGRGSQGCLLKDTTATRVENANTSCVDLFTTMSRLDGDTLVMRPVSVRNSAGIAAQTDTARSMNARRAKLNRAREFANRWVEAGPTEPRALSTLARIDLLLGDLRGADTLLAAGRFGQLDDNERGKTLISRIELALKIGRDAEFLRLVDSNLATHPRGQSANITAEALAIGGRLVMLDSVVSDALRRNRIPIPQPVADYFHSMIRLALTGTAPDSLAKYERATFDLVSPPSPNGGVRNATSVIAVTLMLGLRAPRANWPPIDTSFDRRMGIISAIIGHDTAAMKAGAKMLDSVAQAAADHSEADDGTSMVATDAYLMVGDSAAALATLRRYFEVSVPLTPVLTQIGNGFVFTGFLWPRAMLLRADLEAAKGDKGVARSYYRRLLALWAKADPELQPVVDRARKSLAALGPGL